MTVTSLDTVPQSRSLARPPAFLLLAAGACVLAVLLGNRLLLDPDTLWQIKVGQWIIAHRAVPHVDIYSLTRAGEPWMSSSWLAQVLFASAYDNAGWIGVVVLTALAIATTIGVLVHALERQMSPILAGFVAMVAFALSAQHFLARPHVLAMPIMVAWTAGLIGAADRGARPSFWLLPLLVLWTNLHGGFVLGLALVAPIGLDAVWNAAPARRWPLALQWALFVAAAALACCITPYGWDALLAARKILGLGGALGVIAEWAPLSFARFGLFEGCLLMLLALMLHLGMRLSPPRILLVLGLLHMALTHVRNVEVFALLLPLIVLAPMGARFGAALKPERPGARPSWFGGGLVLVAAVGLIGVLASIRPSRPPLENDSSAAIAALQATGATRVLNDYSLGGAMIWAGLRPFIDSRAELYGESTVVGYFKAISLEEPDGLFRLLADNALGATMLDPATPAVRVMDRLAGWHRVFANDVAVIHVREAPR
ncbi:hypothetical protein JQ557_10470 [Bradyrhizobium sp. U87765 SZCCT0131]|uniref:hypothetical protein n=1 Tax=unclassified Bradyrhizobium TaxID=2631580 RepID=UPI001BAAC6BB|nr:MULTISPECIES: hypothetical protein [unclassified Bradyrhizobium]MBR1218414.1 hypothetical protein [Bradyrhizobium sp. U87765 SZCCT0131]MBR1260640.1 hypothetical protein [Bradyrhizobium sp. U87765 SZCCT0134]MBR1303912.1 hypothetical protein [Bradyrhizobium sp. U87765 SZCCT0110]MBR1319518.1 hypothetical protein [Bradyrhizobium sp. U87765 SZCCT0109]MBR1347843.1 hypothetical protein [Bradyrhizobium sp. U87765 SZCCT0048]